MDALGVAVTALHIAFAAEWFGHKLSLPSDLRAGIHAMEGPEAGRVGRLRRAVGLDWVAAVGVPRLVKRDWVKRGAAVIDVGVTVVDGVLTGDVDTDGVSGVARLVTPHRRDPSLDAMVAYVRATAY